MKRGDVFIRARVVRSGLDEDGPCRVKFDRHFLRSVRKGVAFVTQKNQWTWVKAGFGKHAPWGWAASIPHYYRDSFPVADAAAKGFCRSESAAVKAHLRSLRDQRKYWLREGDAASVAAIDEEAACMKRWLARDRDGGSAGDAARGSTAKQRQPGPCEDTASPNLSPEIPMHHNNQEPVCEVVEGSFQSRVQPWLMECFGEMIAGDREERNHRFLEEALECVQSLGCSSSEAHQLVDYVYGRPAGHPPQEIGGVMVTLAALCLANDLDMHAAGWVELERVWTKVEQIRAKQAAKPKHSPLPPEPPTSSGWQDYERGLEDAARAADSFASAIGPHEKGYSYFSPDSGNEWSRNHPWQSGECPDAASVTRMTFGSWCNKFNYAPTAIATAIRALKSPAAPEQQP